MTTWDTYCHCILYDAQVGSRAYGLHRLDSDEDRKGFYVAPLPMLLGLHTPPEQINRPDVDHVYYEVGKFCRMVLAGNPSILEALWSPRLFWYAPDARPIVELRERALSRRLVATYGGYAHEQFKRLDRHKYEAGEGRERKQALHMLRLLYCGAAALRRGFIPVSVNALGPHQFHCLLSLRDEAVPWALLMDWRAQAVREFEDAAERTTLPDYPDTEAFHVALVSLRRTYDGG